MDDVTLKKFELRPFNSECSKVADVVAIINCDPDS